MLTWFLKDNGNTRPKAILFEKLNHLKQEMEATVDEL
jgi:hypothetical protein